MEYTFRKWRTLRRKFSVAITIPLFAMGAFSAYYLYGKYDQFLDEVNYKNDLIKMITLSTLELELNRETQSMRSFYLGVQNFDHLRLQKEFTDKAIKNFKKVFSRDKSALQGVEANVMGALSVARDQVLSGQSRWPETQKKMNEVNLWMHSFTPAYKNLDRVHPFKFQLDKLQEGVVSTRELKNNLAFVVVRDMPLNSIQFSNLISSYERAQYLHKQAADFLMSASDRMKFLYNQQMIMWGKITADYEKTLETVEDGRYSIRLPNLLKRFERLEKSQMAPVQLKRDMVLKYAEDHVAKTRGDFLYSFFLVAGAFFLVLRFSISGYRKGLFYLATSFNGHEIKMISDGIKEGKVTPMYPLISRTDEYLDKAEKQHIA